MGSYHASGFPILTILNINNLTLDIEPCKLKNNTFVLKNQTSKNSTPKVKSPVAPSVLRTFYTENCFLLEKH